LSVDALKLTTYFGERDRVGRRLLADELFDLYGRHEIAASVLVRGIEGFGAKHRMRTDLLLTLSEDLPVVSVAVDVRERVEQLLPEVMAIKRRGLVTLERARLLTGEIGGPPPPGREEAPLPPPRGGEGGTPLRGELGEATKLTLYVGRHGRARGKPAFIAICEALHSHGLAGATVLLGVDGTLHRERQRARFFARNAQVPLMIISVGPGEQIARALPALAEMVDRPLVTLERVQVCKRAGALLARPHALPATDEHGLGIWQKLMVHTSEDAQADGGTLHRELVRRLRAAHVAGATSVRGIWGFRGDHAPHGDRLLQARRHVPVLTTIIDRPERIALAFQIVDELTAKRGLVTSEMVPAAVAWIEEERHSGMRLAHHRF
jgi:PII-like signaling protein